LLGIKLQIQQLDVDSPHSPGSVALQVGDVHVGNEPKRKGDEAYRLTVDSERGVEIVGTDPSGVFYGVQTLRALLPLDAYREPAADLKIDAVRIADSPRFRYRGVHLDVARNFQRKETVKKLLDLMAFYKLNRLHWHLTDDEGWRVEIKQLPELTAVAARRGHTLTENEFLQPAFGSGPHPMAATSPGNGYYSHDDVIEILRYAAERHITVIPEIDLPGHARAAIMAVEARSRGLSHRGDDRAETLLLRDPNDSSTYESVQMWNDNVVDVGRDDTYRFVSLIANELAAIYDRAGVPLTMIHLGGDEVPKGAWEKSPACEAISIATNSHIPRREQLELYFLDRASLLLAESSIQTACWEDCLLLETNEDPNAGRTRRASSRPTPTAYVWNNVWGWGREDAAYRLANAGFDVVLCNATHLYFDLACEKDPLEPGYYWAGFVNARKPFEFVPLDVFQNADKTTMGEPLDPSSFAGRTRLTDDGARHVLGIQGQLWAENLRDSRTLEYMAFPRLIALAERAWARSPKWAAITDAAERSNSLERDWNQFANRLGQRELPRLDWLYGGVHYRLPPPGAIVRQGLVHANVEFPGVRIRYTTDGSEPENASPLFDEPVPVSAGIQLRSFDSRGRGSRLSKLRAAAN
jgi:hexosaminidase